jgi:hypothetical protein
MAKVEFDFFLDFFPEIALPITLTDEVHHEFSKENKALPPQAISEYISRYEAKEVDDFTEYIACFRFPSAEQYQGLVYWKAGLLNYDFVLVTYSKLGNMIDKRAIAGTKVEGGKVRKIVATIDEHLTIFMVEGAAEDELNYEANSSRVQKLEILENGRIM